MGSIPAGNGKSALPFGGALLRPGECFFEFSHLPFVSFKNTRCSQIEKIPYLRIQNVLDQLFFKNKEQAKCSLFLDLL